MKTTRERAARVVERLVKAGFEAYFAGGCVRDLLLGRTPKDYDMATSALPEDVERIFRRTYAVGKAFGVIRVLSGEDGFDVATFRKDAPYADHRRPSGVTFSDAREDALRRDFTINGMFYDPVREEVIDFVDGKADLDNRLIRAIGDPDARFDEDHLRLLRAARFSSTLAFAIEDRTREAIQARAGDIRTVSAERVRDELNRILLGPDPAGGLQLLLDLGLLELILPEVSSLRGVEQPPEFHPEGDVWTHTLLLIRSLQDPSLELLLGGLLHDIGKPVTFERASDRIRFSGHAEVGADMAAATLDRLRYPAHTREVVLELVRGHMHFIEVKNMRKGTLKRFLRREHFPLHLELHRADCLASHKNLKHWEFCKEKLDEFRSDRDALRVPKLLDGNDLTAMGYKPGPLFGKILDALEDAQLEGRVKTADEARAFVREGWTPTGPS